MRVDRLYVGHITKLNEDGTYNVKYFSGVGEDYVTRNRIAGTCTCIHTYIPLHTYPYTHTYIHTLKHRAPDLLSASCLLAAR